MFDAFTKVVAQADARGQFLNASEIDALAAMVSESNKRLDTVNRITSNASSIVADAARQLFAQQPALIAPGGNAYTSRRMAACLRDMEIILRYVTYSIFTGDASVMEDRCLNGLRETYLALGTPGASVAAGVNMMKDAAISIANDKAGITNGDCTALMSEIGTYFDRAAAAVACFRRSHHLFQTHENPPHRSGCRRRLPGSLPQQHRNPGCFRSLQPRQGCSRGC
jgi:phycocyanin beta chain